MDGTPDGEPELADHLICSMQRGQVHSCSVNRQLTFVNEFKGMVNFDQWSK
jgi:hypothetical protein